MNIVCNENVTVKVNSTGTFPNGTPWTRYEFYPSDGYALWRDNEIGNIDPETGEPWCYWLSIAAMDNEVEEFASHIWAKLIDETMEVFGDTEPEQPVMKARTFRAVSRNEPSGTYIDKNGVEREKKGVY